MSSKKRVYVDYQKVGEVFPNTCPKCGGDLKVVNRKMGKLFKCDCGYRCGNFKGEK